MSNRIKETQMYNVEILLNILQKQFQFIMGEDPDYYSNYQIILKNEQSYIGMQGRKEPGNIYMVVKFLPASINYGQNTVPFTISAVSEYNKFNTCQRLLMEYCQYWNLKTGEQFLDDEFLIAYNQTYDGPSVMSNFNDIYNGHRCVYMMSGTFLLSYNTNAFEVYYYKNPDNLTNGEKLEIIGNVNNVDFHLDIQPYTNSQNFTKSMTQFATDSMNITIYLTNCDICNKALKLKHKTLKLIENDFILGIKYRNQEELNDGSSSPFISHYKLQNVAIAYNMGELPTISMTLTN